MSVSVSHSLFLRKNSKRKAKGICRFVCNLHNKKGNYYFLPKQGEWTLTVLPLSSQQTPLLLLTDSSSFHRHRHRHRHNRNGSSLDPQVPAPPPCMASPISFRYRYSIPFPFNSHFNLFFYGLIAFSAE